MEKNKKMIYLYITPFFPAPNYWRGGFFYDAVKSLIADGRYRVVVLTPSEDHTNYTYQGIDVYRFNRKKIGSAQYAETLLEGINNHLLLRRLNELNIEVNDIAVCHIHDHNHYVHYATCIKKLNPHCLALVHHHYSGWYETAIGKLGEFPVLTDIRYMHMCKQYASVDAHVFISEDSRNSFGKYRSQASCEDYRELRQTTLMGTRLPLIKYKDSYVWYNGVDTEVFHPTEIEKAQGHVIGYVANYNPGKAHIDLFKAFVEIKKQYPDARLKLVGSGQMLPACKQFAEDNGIWGSVDFIKEMPHDKLADFYRSLDVFVMPSINEGFCCVNAEANACGTPAMACAGLPFEELLSEDDKKKWLIGKHDPESIVRQVCRFFETRDKQVFIKNLNSNYLASKFLDWVDEKGNKL